MSFGGGGVGLEDAAKGAVLPVHFAWQGRFCSESSPGWWNTPQHTGSSSASSAQDDLKEVIFQSLDLKKKKKKKLKAHPLGFFLAVISLTAAFTSSRENALIASLPPYGTDHGSWELLQLHKMFFISILFLGAEGIKYAYLTTEKKRLFPWEKICFV